MQVEYDLATESAHSKFCEQDFARDPIAVKYYNTVCHIGGTYAANYRRGGRACLVGTLKTARESAAKVAERQGIFDDSKY